MAVNRGRKTVSNEAHSKARDARPLWEKPTIKELSPDDPRCVALAAKAERQRAVEGN